MTRSATGRGSSAPRPRPRRPPARSAHRTRKEGCAARGGIRLLGRNPAGAGRQPASVHQRRSKQALHQTARNGHEPPASRGRMPGPRSQAGGATQGRWAPRPPRATLCSARASSPGRRACAPLRDTGLPPPPLPGRPSTDVVAGSRRKHVSQPVRAGASEPRGGRRRRSRVAGGGGAGSRAHGLLGSTRWLLTAPVPGRLRLRCSAALTAAGHLHA